MKMTEYLVFSYSFMLPTFVRRRSNWRCYVALIMRDIKAFELHAISAPDRRQLIYSSRSHDHPR